MKLLFLCSLLASVLSFAAAAYWLEDPSFHNGLAAGNADPSSYTVFRNVKDFGATGDGSTDDTAAINEAISSGDRCGLGCEGTTRTPALIYFPPGTYMVSAPIIAYYYSQLVGDINDRPIIRALPSFLGMALIDADPYEDGGVNWYVNQNSFFREVRNFIVDVSLMPPDIGAGIHWQVSQATSLTNIDFIMSEAEGNAQQGIFMENGSGGILTNLTFTGGGIGATFGNQQFTLIGLRFNKCQTAMSQLWNWGWSMHDIHITDCKVGLSMITGTEGRLGQAVNSEVLVDWVVRNTPTAISMTVANAANLVIENMQIEGVDAVVSAANATVLAGTSDASTIASWIQGKVYEGTTEGKAIQGEYTPTTRPTGLVDSANKRYFHRNQPQYADAKVSDFVNAKSDCGAKGDGTGDDLANLQKCFDDNAATKIIWVPAGQYSITDTLKIPAGTRLVGEVTPYIQGTGANFGNRDQPRPVVQVGQPGEKGVMEISNMIFSTKGPASGAIVLEWNIAESSQGSAGMWSSHLVLGGYAGSETQTAQCDSNATYSDACRVAFLGMHITEQASAYIENSWIWTADHDIESDTNKQINLFSGRGVLVEATAGPVWLWGTGSEHHLLYQYNIVNANNVFLALIQTETPYFLGKGSPTATDLEPPVAAFNDPTFANCEEGDTSCDRSWGLRIAASDNVLLYGAGLYSFFDNYEQNCLPTNDCQEGLFSVEGAGKGVALWTLWSVGVTNIVQNAGTAIVKSADNLMGGGVSQGIAAWAAGSGATVQAVAQADAGTGNEKKNVKNEDNKPNTSNLKSATAEGAIRSTSPSGTAQFVIEQDSASSQIVWSLAIIVLSGILNLLFLE